MTRHDRDCRYPEDPGCTCAERDDTDPGLPPPEVIDAFLKDCRCCDCADRPCAGVMAGGMCDEMCFCSRDTETDDNDEPYSIADGGEFTP